MVKRRNLIAIIVLLTLILMTGLLVLTFSQEKSSNQGGTIFTGEVIYMKEPVEPQVYEPTLATYLKDD